MQFMLKDHGAKIDDKMISLATLNKITGIWFLEQFKFSALIISTSAAALGLLQRKDHSLFIAHFKKHIPRVTSWQIKSIISLFHYRSQLCVHKKRLRTYFTTNKCVMWEAKQCLNSYSHFQNHSKILQILANIQSELQCNIITMLSLLVLHYFQSPAARELFCWGLK